MFTINDPWFRMRPLGTSDYAALRELESGFDADPLWRFLGSTPSPQDHVASLWTGVLGQCVIEQGDGTPFGLCTAYQADWKGGTCHVAVVAVPSAQRSGRGVMALIQFATELFREFPFRYLYAETLDVHFDQFKSVERSDAVTVVGRLVDDARGPDRLHDRIVLAVERDAFFRSYGASALARRSRAAYATTPMNDGHLVVSI